MRLLLSCSSEDTTSSKKNSQHFSNQRVVSCSYLVTKYSGVERNSQQNHVLESHEIHGVRRTTTVTYDTTNQRRLRVWVGGEVDRLCPEVASKIARAAERVSPVKRQQVSLCHFAPNLLRVAEKENARSRAREIQKYMGLMNVG